MIDIAKRPGVISGLFALNGKEKFQRKIRKPNKYLVLPKSTLRHVF